MITPPNIFINFVRCELLSQLTIVNMNQSDIKTLESDTDGLKTYEYLANNIDNPDLDMDYVISRLRDLDLTGQFLASAARYLHAIDHDRFESAIRLMVSLTIDRDRERRYIGDLLTSLYGPDYARHADELSAKDNNFRRMYKRLYSNSAL